MGFDSSIGHMSTTEVYVPPDAYVAEIVEGKMKCHFESMHFESTDASHYVHIVLGSNDETTESDGYVCQRHIPKFIDIHDASDVTVIEITAKELPR